MNKHYKYFTVLLLRLASAFFCCMPATKAQLYSFRHYQVENGLSNNTVYCSAQDKNGFLWFGTKDGLNRFDGYHFKLYNSKDEGYGPIPDIISCILADPEGKLWVGSQKGLYTFDTETESLVRFIDDLPEITGIQFDNEGQLWLISAFTLWKYDIASKKLKVYPPAGFFSPTSLCLDNNGTIWVSTTDGFLQRYNRDTDSFRSYNLFSHSPHAASNWIQKIYADKKGSIYIGTSSQGIKRFDIAPTTYKDVLTANPDKTAIYVRDVAEYTGGQIWFATESGIFIYYSESGQFINLKKKFLDPYSLSDNAVYTLCKDTEGGIWAGTYFGGVNYYSKQFAAFQKYFPDYTKNSISGSAVREICADKFGNVWIGTEDAGLNKLNPQTGVITRFQPTGENNSIAYTNIHGLLADGNHLWIGTFEHGLDVLDIRTGKVIKHYAAGPGERELKSNFIVSLLKTTSGEIYVGTSNGLNRYNPKTNDFEMTTETAPNIFVSVMAEDKNKTIWIATHGRGVYYFNPGTKQKGHLQNVPADKHSLPANTVNAIYEDSQRNTWFCTEGGGLCKLSRDRKVFTTYTTSNGLPSNFIFKVLEDDKMNLWLTTSRGLVNMNPTDLSIKIYTKDNGLLNDQFNYNSGYKGPDSKMYFGSVKGMITFRPNDLSQNKTGAPLYITGFQVQNKELEINNDSSFLKRSIIYTDEIILPYDRSSFSIDFAALSYLSPEMTSYSYYMQGVDKEWTRIKPNRKIYFTNLSPGNYTFKLKAATNGNGSQKERLLSIKILPPYWASIGAYLLYATFAIALCYYLLRSYRVRLEDKKEKEIYEAKIDFFTNVAHEIRTPLTLIKGPVENLLEKVDKVPEIKEDVVLMERNTDRLIALVTQILDFRQTETRGFSIDLTKANITELLKEDYFNFMPLAKKRNLHYTIETPPNEVFAFADEEALHKIFSNLLNNAVKYAHKKIHVRLHPVNKDNTTFTIDITNDGFVIPPEMKEKIFEPFYRLKETLKTRGTGLGLALSRSLAALHNGDLYLDDSQAGLNTFVLCLPLVPERKANRNFKNNTAAKPVK